MSLLTCGIVAAVARLNSADDVDIIGEVGVNGGQGKRGGEGKLLTVARPPLIHGCLARVGKLF